MEKKEEKEINKQIVLCCVLRRHFDRLNVVLCAAPHQSTCR